MRWLAQAAAIRTGARGDSSLPWFSQEQRHALLRTVLQLKQGMPLAYVLRTVPFATLELAVEPPTLIPRPETEAWTVRLADLFASGRSPYRSQSLRIVDLCTGTGAIGLYLAHRLKRSEVTLVDAVPSAVELARTNAQRVFNGTCASHHTSPAPNVVQADLFGFPSGWTPHEKVDLITCNPPYVTPGEYSTLDRSIRNYEDPLALVGVRPDQPTQNQDDLNGLAFYRRIAEVVPHVLNGGAIRISDPSDPPDYLPQLALEIGPTQAKEVIEILQKAEPPKHLLPLTLATEVWKDLAGLDRVVLAAWVPND